MRVLLLGATGGLGSAILRQLLATTSHEVTVLVRSPAKLAPAALAAGSRVTVVRGDASAAAGLAPTHGALINAAGRPNEPGNDLETVITEVLIAAAALAPPRLLVLTGGMGILDAPGGRPAGLLPLVPASVQSFTRVHASTLARVMAAFPPAGATIEAGTHAEPPTAATTVPAAGGGAGTAAATVAAGGPVKAPVVWALFCPAYMKDVPSRRIPITLNADYCPAFPPDAWGSAVLAYAPGAVVAATLGARSGSLALPFDDAAAAMIAPLSWPLPAAVVTAAATAATAAAAAAVTAASHAGAVAPTATATGGMAPQSTATIATTAGAPAATAAASAAAPPATGPADDAASDGRMAASAGAGTRDAAAAAAVAPGSGIATGTPTGHATAASVDAGHASAPPQPPLTADAAERGAGAAQVPPGSAATSTAPVAAAAPAAPAAATPITVPVVLAPSDEARGFVSLWYHRIGMA